MAYKMEMSVTINQTCIGRRN